MGKTRRKTARRRTKRGYVFLAVIIIFSAYMVCFWNYRISPNLDTIAEMKARLIVTKAVNGAIRERLYQEASAEKLLIAETSDDGTIEMVQSDTVAINKLLSDLSAELQKSYRKGNLGQTATVPLGSILGSRILSQYGPSVELTIIPVAVSHMDFITEFETQGINQTKYKVYAVINTEARVLAPFTTDTIEIENTVLIAEAIILGQVPDTYVNVPENEILDAIQ